MPQIRTIRNPHGVPIQVVVTEQKGVARVSIRFGAGVMTPQKRQARAGDTLHGLILHAIGTGEVFPLLDWLEESDRLIASLLAKHRAAGGSFRPAKRVKLIYGDF